MFGRGRFNATYRGPDSDAVHRIAPDRPGAVRGWRESGRALPTGAAVENYRAGVPGEKAAP